MARSLHLSFLALSFATYISLSYATPTPYEAATLQRRATYRLMNESGILQAVNIDSGQSIQQGAASDGAGNGVDATVILWILFTFLIGIPLACAGVRGGRFTAGLGVALAFAFTFWVTIINTVSAVGIPDLAVVFITLFLFVLGFFTGFCTFDFRSDVVLSLVGVASVLMRVVVFKADTLISPTFINWILIGVAGAAGASVSYFWRRWGAIVGSATSGTFLFAVGADIAMSKQNGISRGLRVLFDKNPAHMIDIRENGYHPPISTVVWLSMSLVLIPFCVYGQHKFFKYCTFCTTTKHGDALSFYAHDEERVDGSGPFIQKHRPMSQRQRISLMIDTKLPKVHVPIRLSFARLAEKDKMTEIMR